MLRAMTLRLSLVAMATSLALAGCGGTSHGSSNATATATATATAAASSQTTTPVATSGPSTSTTQSTSAPPEVPKAKKEKHHGPSHAVSQGAHVKTTLAVSASGDVAPPVVSVPSGVGVEIHVTNHGGATATVALAVPTHPSIHVHAGASGTLQTGGLKDGTYRILVNGTPRGQLLIGAQGGP
jgi:hypothetical protein